MKKAVFVFLFAVLAFCARLTPAFADTVPPNGSFQGGLYQWFNQGGGQWSPNGRTAGAYQVTSGNGGVFAGIISRPFLVGTSAFVTFYYSTGGTNENFSFDLLVHDTSTVVRQSFAQNLSCTAGQWCSTVFSLAAYAGDTVSLHFYNNNYFGNNQYISDISVSPATASDPTAPGYINGQFSGSLTRWVNPGDYTHTDWWGGLGHNGLGVARYFGFGGYNYLLSFPFTADNQIYSFYVQGQSGQTSVGFDAKLVDWTTGQVYPLNDSTARYNVANAWYGFTFDSSAYTGHIVSLWFGIFSMVNSYIYLDDLCPASTGCFQGTYPAATATPSNATATPITVINLTPYPTFPPYPTQYPYPTYPPYPTSIYGNGTPQPVTITGEVCPQNAPCYVVWGGGTPFDVNIVNSTPLAVELKNTNPITVTFGGTPQPIQGGNSTPVVVTFGTPAFPTPNVNFNSAGNMVTVGGVVASANVSTNDGYVPIPRASGSSSSISHDSGLHVDSIAYSFCFPSAIQVFIKDVPCFSGTLYNIATLHIMGIDFAPVFAALSVTAFIVFLIRRLQAR